MTLAEEIKLIAAIAYTTKLAAQVTGRSHTRIKKAIREKELTARKDGRATIIEHAELQRWVASLPTIGRPPEPVVLVAPPAVAKGRAPERAELQRRLAALPAIGRPSSPERVATPVAAKGRAPGQRAPRALASNK